MPLLNTRHRYGRVAQCLHWLTAALILSMLALGLWMTGLPATDQAEVSRTVFFYSLHKTLGIATLVVVLVRIGWAIGSAHPGLLNADRRLEAFAAAAVHWILYGAILLMPLSGWIQHAAHAGSAPIWWPPGLDLGQALPLVPRSTAVSHLFGALHEVLAWTIVGAIALHVAGALKHALVDRDDTLRRMLPVGRPATAVPPAAQPSAAGPFAAAALLFVAVFGVAAWLAGTGDPEARPAMAGGDAAQAGNWSVDSQASRLGIEVQLMGSTVSGAFESWTAAIRFDPEDLAGSRVSVDIDAASLRLGDVSEQAADAAYLDVASHPLARFEASSFRQLGPTDYEASGSLTLRGVTAPVTLPFDLQIDGDTATMSGRTQVDRLAFGIGAEAMPGEDTLGFPVDVVVELRATRKVAGQ